MSVEAAPLRSELEAGAADRVAVSEEDLFGDAVLCDRDAFYGGWRERAAVVHLTTNRLWALTRYRDIRRALSDPGTFSSRRATFNDMMNGALRGSSLVSDPPEHSAARAALAKYLSPRVVRARRELMHDYADELVAAAVAAGSFDAARLAQSFHQRVIGETIGMRREIQSRVVPWGDSALNIFGPFNRRTKQHLPVAGDLVKWAQAVTADQLTPGSVGADVFAAAERGEIPADAPNKLIHQLVAAGIDTAIASLGNVFAHLGTHPQQYERLRADPTLIGATINESLRYESPIHAMARHVTRDVEVAGTLIPAGAQVALLFPAGNRDPRHYDEPDTFRIERNPLDHLSFGHGVHACAGMGLVRAELEAVLGAVIRRARHIEAGDGRRKLSNMVSSYETLPVTVTAA